MQNTDKVLQEIRLIGQLMAKRKAGLPLTTSENDQLDEWLSRSDGHAQAFNDFSDDTALLQESTTFEALATYYRAKNPALAQAKPAPVIPLWLRRTIAAAAIAGLLLLSFFMWNNRTRPPQAAEAVAGPVHDALPGSQKAILLVDNGRRYELSAAGKDSIGTIGGQMVMAANGQLEYTPGADRPDGPLPSSINTVTTPKGGGYQVKLSDGSVILLNANSSLSFPATFTGDERRIRLNGEAYLTVAKQTGKDGRRIPFVVHTSDGDIEVLGTQFNVNTYGDRFPMKTTLLEGRVAIRKGQSPPIEMKPGQRAVVESTGVVDVQELSDPSADIAWTRNVFYFKDNRFDEVMQQLSRWYDVEVKYEGAVPVFDGGGFIQRDIKLSELLKQLTFILHDKVSFRVDGKTLWVRQNKP